MSGEEVDFSVEALGEEDGAEASRRLAEAVAKAVAHCQAAGAGREEAEDCVQDAVVAMLTSSSGAAVRRPEAWLTVVARRRLVDRIRRRQAEQTALNQGLMWVAHTGLEQDVAELVADRDLARWQVEALADLPPVTQQVCAATSAGLAVGQVAEQVGISTRSVESHLSRARIFIRSLTQGGSLVVICAVVRRLTRPRPWMEVADKAPDGIRLVAASALVATVSVASGPSGPPGRPRAPRVQAPVAAGLVRSPVAGHDPSPIPMGGSHRDMPISHLRGFTRAHHVARTPPADKTPLSLHPLRTAVVATDTLKHPVIHTVTDALTALPAVTLANLRVTGPAGLLR